MDKQRAIRNNLSTHSTSASIPYCCRAGKFIPNEDEKDNVTSIQLLSSLLIRPSGFWENSPSQQSEGKMGYTMSPVDHGADTNKKKHWKYAPGTSSSKIMLVPLLIKWHTQCYTKDTTLLSLYLTIPCDQDHRNQSKLLLLQFEDLQMMNK